MPLMSKKSTIAAHYTSRRIFSGVETVSAQKAAATRKAIREAFERMGTDKATETTFEPRK